MSLSDKPIEPPDFIGPQDAVTSTLDNPQDWLLEALYASASAAGVKVSPLSAMGVPTVFACVNAVSRSMSSIPLKLKRRTPDGGSEDAVDHPLYFLPHDAPNDEMTSASFRRAMQANVTLRNNSFAMIIRNGRDQVAEIVPIPNNEITLIREPVSKRLIYRVNSIEVRSESILHLKGLTFNGNIGVDPVSTVRESIGLAIALLDHGARFFPNATTPSMILEQSKNMDQKQLADFAKSFDQVNSGNANAHKRMILHGGWTATQKANTNNQQSQFLESRIEQRKEICQAFGVPQIKAGITDAAHYSNVEHENQSYVTDTLQPNAVEWEQSLNQKLLLPEERKTYFFKFSFNGLLRGDVAARFAAYEKSLQNGIMSRNEVRRLEELNPVPGGDLFTVSQNVQLLDAAGQPIVVPEPNQPAV